MVGLSKDKKHRIKNGDSVYIVQWVKYGYWWIDEDNGFYIKSRVANNKNELEEILGKEIYKKLLFETQLEDILK